MSGNSEEQFSLHWNDFHSNFSEGFHSLLKTEDLVDVTLAADNKYVQAHRLVLSVCSPYFKDLFRVNPCKHPTVILKGVAFQDLMNILEFMYRGQVNVQHDGLSDFLKTAEMLQVKGLCDDDDSVKHALADASSSLTSKAREKKVSTQHVNKKPVIQDVKSKWSDEVSSPPLKRKRLAPPARKPSIPPHVKEEMIVLSKPYDEESCDEVEFVSVIEPKDEMPDDEEEESVLEEGEIIQDEKQNFSSIFNESDFAMQNISDCQYETNFPSSSQALHVEGGEQDLVHFIPGPKGNRHLVYNNFVFYKDRERVDRIYWKCSRMIKYKCPARMITTLNKVYWNGIEHNHSAEKQETIHKRILRNTKEIPHIEEKSPKKSTMHPKLKMVGTLSTSEVTP